MIIPVTEENIEDFIWEFSPQVQRRLDAARKELKKGEGALLKELFPIHGTPT